MYIHIAVQMIVWIPQILFNSLDKFRVLIAISEIVIIAHSFCKNLHY